MSPEDIETARECYRAEVLPTVEDGSYDGPSLVVLSSGYAEVWSDGDVTQHRRIVGNVADE